MKVLQISTYAPADTTAGALLLHRHYTRAGDAITLSGAFLHGSAGPTFRVVPRRWFSLRHRAGRRVQQLAQVGDVLHGISLPFSPLLRWARRQAPDVIVTVAEGAITVRAWQVARRLRCPLVTVWHDWPADGLDIPLRCRETVRARMRRIGRESVALSVSPEIRTAADGGPRNHVLYPIPAGAPAGALPPDSAFHALFAGRFEHFLQDEMLNLVQHLLATGQAGLLRVIGPTDNWRDTTRQAFEATGCHHGFHKGAALQARLQAAPALLVICPFGTEAAHMARYSFPSKIPEYCHHGRPIVIWGPDHAAAVHWARESQAACVVTDPNPAGLLAALRALQADPARCAQLGARTLHEAQTRFAPAELQRIFMAALTEAAASRR